MKTLTTMAFLAAMLVSASVSARSMVVAEENVQNRDYYVGAPCATAAPCTTTCAPPPLCPCAPKVTTCCQKMERVCTPCGSVCCPEVRGLFDGGRCCNQ